MVLSSPPYFAKRLFPMNFSPSLLGQFVDMVTELGKQLLFTFFGATAFAFIDHLAEVGIVRDGIVLLVVMHIFCRTTWNVVKKQFGGKVLAVDVEGHVYLNYFSLKRFVVKPYVGLVSKDMKNC